MTVLLAVTRSPESCERLLMMLSVIPSERYSASGSALALMKGSTARESIGCFSLSTTFASAAERSVTVRSSTVTSFTVGSEAVAAAGDGLDVLIVGKSTTQREDVAR